MSRNPDRSDRSEDEQRRTNTSGSTLSRRGMLQAAGAVALFGKGVSPAVASGGSGADAQMSDTEIAEQWRSTGVGDVPVTGSLSVDGDSLTVEGSGSIYATGHEDDDTNASQYSDSFQFAHKEVTGNFELIARFDEPLDSEGRAGPMVRAGTDDDDPYAAALYVDVDSDGDGTGDAAEAATASGRRWKGESVPHRTGNLNSTPTVEFPIWWRVTRYGDKVLCHRADGMSSMPSEKDWNVVPQGTPIRLDADLPETVEVGFAVHSEGQNSLTQASFSDVDLEPLQRDFRTTWVGNSFGGGWYHVTAGAWGIDVHGPSNRLSTNGIDEYHSAGLWHTDGTFRVYGQKSHFNQGTATAIDDQHFYHSKQPGVRVYRHDGEVADGTSVLIDGKSIGGMAVDSSGDRLFVTDTDDEKVHVFDTSSSSRPQVNSFSVTNPRKIAYDSDDGSLWIVEYGSPTSPKGQLENTYFDREENGTAKVHNYSTGGSKRSTFTPSDAVSSDVVPRGLAVNPATGNLWLADAGPANQIQIFAPNGRLRGSFGAEGGVHAAHDGTVSGETHPKKFDHPTDVAFDDSRNAYVSATATATDWRKSGATVRKFDVTEDAERGKAPENAQNDKHSEQAKDLIWERRCTEFMQSGDFDPDDPTRIDSMTHSHTIEYDTEPGEPAGGETGPGPHWDTIASHYNPYRTQDDPRLNGEDGSVITAKIDGEKFFFLQPGVTTKLWVFRYDGMETVLCGRFSNDGDGNVELWLDENGDETIQDSEKTSGPPINDYLSRGFDVDDEGAVWVNGESQVYRYEPDGVSSVGHPNYSHDNRRKRPINDIFTGSGAEPKRLKYEVDTDTLYATGFTEKNPETDDYHWKCGGSEIVRLDDWVASSYSGDEEAPGRLDRSGWTASDNQGSRDPYLAIDPDRTARRWHSDERDQDEGTYWQVDFGEVQKVNRIELIDQFHDDKYPEHFAVKVSTDGLSWTTVKQVEDGASLTIDGTTEASFDTQEVRYLRVEITADSSRFWHIHNFYAYYDEPPERNVEPTWRVKPIKNPSTRGNASQNMQTIAVAGDYVFMANNQFYIDVYDKSDGSELQDRLFRGVEVAGNGGLIDIMNGVRATQRDDGTYLIMAEEMYEKKNTIFHWDPDEGLPPATQSDEHGKDGNGNDGGNGNSGKVVQQEGGSEL